MKLIIILLFAISSAFAQRQATIDADCLRIKDGTCIDKLELGYLDGASSNIQAQLDAKGDNSAIQSELDSKVNDTGDESIAGVKTFTGKIVASSTANGSIPCPAMTEAQRDAIGAPSQGDCVYNSNSKTLNIYNGTIWKSAGGGIAAWETSFSYALNDVVIESSKIYQCIEAHTSGTFATDLAALKWSQIAHNVGDATGVLALANGGTAKNLTASNGAIAYTDTDSMELLAPGTAGQVLQTNGAAAPTFVNKSISAKAGSASSVTAEELQVRDNQLTETATNKHLIETNNKNILSNPSLEHPTVPSGSANASSWIASATSISLSTAAIDGSQALLLVSSAAAITATQDSTLYASELDDGVQCLAQVRVKTDTALQVCARQAGVTSTTDCVTTNTDSKWGLYKVPFICGATSNGISIASSGSVTGGAYIDDAFVGAVDLKTDTNNVGPWRSFTPTGSWVSNTTYTGKYRQVGENLEMQVNIALAGAPTSASLTVNLPSGFTIDTSKFPSVDNKKQDSCLIVDQGASFYECTSFYNSSSSVSLLVKNAGSTYLLNNTTVTQAVPITFGNTDYINFVVSVPVTQFAGSSSIYSASCGANCVDTFSATLNSSSVVSSENVNWINGNGSYSSGDTTISFNSGIFSVAPNCVATVDGSSGSVANITSTSSTQVIVRTKSGGVDTQLGMKIVCQKQGSDFVATRTIVGSFNEVVTAPGITKPKTCTYMFGGASATLASPTECTTGTCVEVYDSCGSISPPAYSGGAYVDLTISNGTFKASSPITCKCEAFDVTTANAKECGFYFITSDNTWSTNSNGGYVGNVIPYQTNGAGTSDGYVALTCTSEAP